MPSFLFLSLFYLSFSPFHRFSWLVSLLRSRLFFDFSLAVLEGKGTLTLTRTSICPSVRSFVRSFLRSFVHSFIRSFLSFVRSFLRSFVRSFVRSFLPFVYSFVPFVRSFVPSFVRSFLSFIRSFLSFVRTLVPNVVSFRMLCQPRSTLIYTGWGMMLHNREQHQHCCTLHFFPLRSFVYRSLDSSVNYVDTNNSSSLEKTLDSILISERLTWIYESI